MTADLTNLTPADWARQGEIYRKMLIRDQVQDGQQRVNVFDRAYQCFSSAIAGYQSINKSNRYDGALAWANAHRGATYLLQNNYDMAEEDFKAAVKLNSEYVWGWAQLGELYRLQGVYWAFEGGDHADTALKFFNQAVDSFNKILGPLSPSQGTPPPLDPYYNWAYAHRGAAYRSRGLLHNRTPQEQKADTQTAIQDLTSAIELNKDYVWAYAFRSVALRTLAMLESDAGSFKDAYNSMDRAYLDCAKVVMIYPALFEISIAEHVGQNILETADDMEGQRRDDVWAREVYAGVKHIRN